MEIDRIQAVKGLKVERTGSEQERRRRPQTEEDFSELLESSMSEELGDEESQQEQQPPPRERPRDTVSITGSEVPPPVVNDLVSISTKALVNAEMHQASRSVEDNKDAPAQGPDSYIPERRINLEPDATERIKEQQPRPEQEDEDDDDEAPVKIDTLA